MKRYLLSPTAITDIDDIVIYIAQENEIAALKMLDSFYEAMNMLAEHPQMGHSRTDLTEKEVLFWPVRSYLIIYKDTNPIEIVRVLSGFRDITDLLI